MSELNTDSITVSVWRSDLRGGDFEDFEVPQQASQTILDVVTWIQRHADASLSYRFACRVGMCGSCAMMVNGIPRWTCRTHVNRVMRDNRLRIEPLRNLPVIKDLVCDMSEFFEKWKQARGHFEGKATRNEKVASISSKVARASGRQCGDRVHQLRDLLLVLRRGRLESGLPGSSRAQPRLEFTE